MIGSMGHYLKASLLITCLIVGGIPAMAKPLSPTESAQQFYNKVFTVVPVGLPSSETIHKLNPFLTSELAQLLLASEATEIRCAKVTPPDKKPPMIEGSVFIGNYEGATHLDSLTVKLAGNNAIVFAQLRYVDNRFPKGHKYNTFVWVDQLKMSQQKGQWKIADIVFTNQPSMVHYLKDFIIENKGCH